MSRHDAVGAEEITDRQGRLADTGASLAGDIAVLAADAGTDATTEACPLCGGTGCPVVFGKPSADQWQASAEGLLVLAGGLRPDNHGYWACKEGHRWPATVTDWTEAVRAAMRGRPLCPRCGGPSLDLVYPGDPGLDRFAHDLARGLAALAPTDPPPGAMWADRLCQSCGNAWCS